ncbi:MAG: S-methyl-5-thioribose-1-phosphate isomerase [Deltaproteobacteria bacterium]|nr:S-methyl-5-thioribose-1-phosphate isomerase [Deltaproteobacteria bacterium]
MTNVRAMEWTNQGLKLLEQTKLPIEEVWITCTKWQEVADAIKRLAVRGAPAIGCAAAFGVVLAAKSFMEMDRKSFYSALSEAIEGLTRTRPTAVNLFWALNRLKEKLKKSLHLDNSEIVSVLEREAMAILDEDWNLCKKIGRFGADLIPREASILTHCNAGALATGGEGTALAVIKEAHNQGKKIRVFADETRPLLQGARLTVWELMKEGIEVTHICDNAAATLMKSGEIDLAVVGSDRTAANGDVANKIGTYSVAVLCKHHGIPFYAALPMSTLDPSLPDGSHIPIEERGQEEVLSVFEKRIAPKGAKARNPAFDVTPAELVTALITDKGVLRPPFDESIKEALSS